jgi:hypothetical protein
MDRKEARLLLGPHLDKLEALGYSVLSRRVGHDEYFEQQGPSNARYQIEVMIRWEHKPYGPILILGAIDDGGLSAFHPLSDSRLVHPEPKP